VTSKQLRGGAGKANAKVPERKIQRKRFCKSNSTAALHVFVTACFVTAEC
jgi:hypothetical protein